MELEIKLRHPAWAHRGFEVRVNGQPVDAGEPASYVAIKRQWHDGDRIEIRMPFTLRSEGFADKPERVAVLDGPLVLAAAIDRKKPNPGIVSQQGAWLEQLRPVANESETFSAEVFHVPGDPRPESLNLVPFYKLYRRNYEVYWDQFTPEQWQAREKEFAAQAEERRRREALTVDSVNPGEEQNERDHNQMGEKSGSGDFGDHFYRDAAEGGWFSWDLKTLPDEAQNLVLTYWGEDRGRQFDILVDGQKLATERLDGQPSWGLFRSDLSLAACVNQGKAKGNAPSPRLQHLGRRSFWRPDHEGGEESVTRP